MFSQSDVVLLLNVTKCRTIWRTRILENVLNSFPNKSWFLRVCRRSLLKTLWEKEKLLVTSNFSFSLSVFHPFGELSAIIIQFEIVVCKLFQFRRDYTFVVREGLREWMLNTDIDTIKNTPSRRCTLIYRNTYILRSCIKTKFRTVHVMLTSFADDKLNVKRTFGKE